jgi:rieske iron-sulfur protein
MCDGRRTVLKAGFRLGIGLSLAPTVIFGQAAERSLTPQAGDLLVKLGDSSSRPLTPDDILIGASQTAAWAMDPITKTVRSGSRLNQLILLRLDAEKLSPETRSRAADGVVAYTAICTHSGCEVEQWLPDERLLQCPCHFALYDPKDGARVVDGPAPRPLPALPLRIADGTLVVAKPFTAPVAFQIA